MMNNRRIVQYPPYFGVNKLTLVYEDDHPSYMYGYIVDTMIHISFT